MSFQITSGYPQSLIKGDAFSFTISDANHPAGTWTSILYVKNDSGTVVNLAGSQSGTDHLFALSNAFSATLTVGRNLVCVSFSDGTHRQTDDWKQLQVLPDPSTAEPASTAATIVAALETAIASNSSQTSGSFSADGVTVTWTSSAELNRNYAFWKSRVIAEKRQADAARGLCVRNSIGISF